MKIDMRYISKESSIIATFGLICAFAELIAAGISSGLTQISFEISASITFSFVAMIVMYDSIILHMKEYTQNISLIKE